MTPALHPDIERLSEANTELRAELAALLTEAHDLAATDAFHEAVTKGARTLLSAIEDLSFERTLGPVKRADRPAFASMHKNRVSEPARKCCAHHSPIAVK